MTLTSERQALSASRRLIYCFEPSPSRRVRVFFDEARSQDPKKVLRDQRFFHDIVLQDDDEQRSLPSFEHPCGPDLYRGSLELCEEDSFVLHWQVEGPRKLGTQTLKYRRCE